MNFFFDHIVGITLSVVIGFIAINFIAFTYYAVKDINEKKDK